MRAAHRTVLKLIATALLVGAILLGTIAPGAGPSAPPYWAILVLVAVAFVLLWLAIWWNEDNHTDAPTPDNATDEAAVQSVQLRRHHHLGAIDRPQRDVEGDIAALQRERHVDPG